MFSLVSFFKNTYSFLGILWSTFFSFVLVCVFSRKKIANNRKIAIRKQAIILGNGPSLADDFEKILKLQSKRDIDIWAVNNFAISDQFIIIKPGFYVLTDPNYWAVDVSEALLLARNRLIKCFNEQLDWPMVLMVPFDAKGSGFLQNINRRNIDVRFYNRTPVDGFRFFREWIYSNNLGMPAPFNVLIAAICLAITDKYQTVYVSGADHSWHESLLIENGRMLLSQFHFYKENVAAVPVIKTDGSSFTIGDIFIRWGCVFKKYEILDLYARSKGVRIFNISSKSYIDAFEYIQIDDLVLG